MFCLERRLHTLEQHLASIHIDIERYVTMFEVQAAAGNARAYLSRWQKKNLTAVRHHLSELNKLQRLVNKLFTLLCLFLSAMIFVNIFKKCNLADVPKICYKMLDCCLLILFAVYI